MTDAEVEIFRDVYRRQQIGYRRAEEDRDARIRETTTSDGILSLMPAFEMAAQQPPRASSGLVDYYQVLLRAYERNPDSPLFHRAE